MAALTSQDWTLRLADALNAQNLTAGLRGAVEKANAVCSMAFKPTPSLPRCTSMELSAMEGGLPLPEAEADAGVYAKLRELGLALEAKVDDAVALVNEQTLLPR